MVESSQVTERLDPTVVVAIAALFAKDGAAIAVNVAVFNFAGLTIGVVVSLLSLHPAKVADVAIAPSGKNGMLANHVKTSRRVCWLAEFVIWISEIILEFFYPLSLKSTYDNSVSLLSQFKERNLKDSYYDKNDRDDCTPFIKIMFQMISI